MKKRNTKIAVLGLTALALSCSSPRIENADTARVPASSGDRNSETPYLDAIHQPGFIERTGLDNIELLNVLAAKKRMEKIFEFARHEPIPFFAELRKHAPVFVVPGVGPIPDIVLVTKYEDVKKVLESHSTFTVAPYQEIMDATVGQPFMLAHEDSPANDEKHTMRKVLSKKDFKRIKELVGRFAKEAIQKNLRPDGTIDVVASVSRAVPIALNSEYFGFAGPDDETLLKWSRTTQHAFFHNPFKDKQVKRLALQTGKEMREYISKELIPGRKIELANGRPANDIVSRLLMLAQMHSKYGLSEDRIVTDTIGLLVGSVETTSAAIVQALDVLMDRPQELMGAVAAAQTGDDETLSRYVWEALRFRTVNPWLARLSKTPASIGGIQIKAGSLILAATASAMHDEEAFTHPEEFRIDRDPSRYMHLGWDYYRCLGDEVAKVMVPETVRQLLLLPNLRRASKGGALDFSRLEGPQPNPFPEKWVLQADWTPASPPQPEEQPTTLKDVRDFLRLEGFLAKRLDRVENRRAFVQIAHGLLSHDRSKKREAADRMPAFALSMTQGATPDQLKQACMEQNPKSLTVFPDTADRDYYCGLRLDFRACYFTQMVFMKKSSQHAYNYCVYQKGFLSPAERESFQEHLAHMDRFEFLEASRQ